MAKPAPRRRPTKTSNKVATGAGGASPAQADGKRAAGHPAEHVAAVSLQRDGAAAVRPSPAASQKAASPASAASAAAMAASAQDGQSARIARTQARSEGGSFGHLVAAVIGGLVVVAGLALYQWAVPAGDGGEAEAVSALQADLGQLRESVAALTEAASGGAPVDEAALREELTALGERIAAIEESAGSDETSGAIEEVRAAIAAETEAREALGSDLTGRLEAIEAELADTSAEERVALAFAAAELKSAIDRGGAFSAELDAFSSIAPDNAAVETLAPYAQEGLPTRAALAERFPDVARDMLAALRTGEGNDGVFDRLMNSAMSVVTVRPTGEAEGETPQARIARMETRIGEGDFDAALAEWEQLPDAAKTVSEAYAADLRGRAEADRIAEDMLASASEAVAAESN